MVNQVVTVVDAHVEPDLETQLLNGYSQMIDGPRPAGLLHSELLRGQDNRWRIQSTWVSLDALRALRAAGEPPAAIDLFEEVGSDLTHSWFTIENTLPTP